MSLTLDSDAPNNIAAHSTRLLKAHAAADVTHLQALEAKEDREVMSLVSDVAKKDITKTSVQTMEGKAVETKFEATTNKKSS
ncbi:hypothetical protein Tco_0514043 [Tanacetum coccineum]